MWIELLCPSFDRDAVVTVSRVHARAGDRLNVGDAVLDLQVDLSAGDWMDCPALSTCRISIRETGWLRELGVGAGQTIDGAAVIARISSEADEPPAAPARRARVNAATIVDTSDWWAE